MKRLLAVTLVALAALAAPAAARPIPPIWTYKAVMAGNTFWPKYGIDPCVGNLKVAQWVPGAGGAANFTDEVVAWAYLGHYNCTIYWNSHYTTDLGWDNYCKVIIHEMGHLGGLTHSTLSWNIMYPNASKALTPTECGKAPL
jgi:hypothetical protein